MGPALTITYQLHPPADVVAANLSTAKTHEIAVRSADNANTYYAGVRAAIADARSVVGRELTAWRDAVGNKEQTKEAKTVQKEDEDEEQDGEEDV